MPRRWWRPFLRGGKACGEISRRSWTNRTDHLSDTQSSRIDTLAAPMQAEAKRSEESLRNLQGHMAVIDISRREDLQRFKQGTSELDGRVRHM